VTVLLGDALDEALERHDVLGLREAPALREPQRQGEVVQGDPWLDAQLQQGVEYHAVMFDGRRLDASFRRLDPTPFDRQAVRPLPQLLQQPKVFGKTHVVIASDARWLDGVGIRRQLVRPPVVASVVAFDLMRRRGAPEGELGWKLDGTSYHDSPG